jgi:hypothetical protein
MIGNIPKIDFEYFGMLLLGNARGGRMRSAAGYVELIAWCG